MNSRYKILLIIVALSTVSPATAQRVFFGLGSNNVFLHSSSVRSNLVLRDDISYDAWIVRKRQVHGVFTLPSFSFLIAMEYKRFRFVLEPSVNTMNTPYVKSEPLGNGVVKEDKEDYYTDVLTLGLPVTANYNILTSQRRQSRLFLIGGISPEYTTSKQYVSNIYWQRYYVFAVSGIGLQFRGFYRPFLTLKCKTLLNIDNKADSRMNVMFVGYTLHIPSDKVRKRNLYIED